MDGGRQLRRPVACRSVAAHRQRHRDAGLPDRRCSAERAREAGHSAQRSGRLHRRPHRMSYFPRRRALRAVLPSRKSRGVPSACGFLAVSDISYHPEWDGESSQHDLAILHLAEPVEGIEPAALNTSHDLEQIGAGLAGTIVGYGRIGGDYDDWEYEYGIKRTGRVTTASCDPEIQDDDVNDAWSGRWNFLDPVGEPGEDRAPATGDSGGPLFLDFNGSIELAGITRGAG